MTVGNRSKLCYILTSFTITYVPTTCERLFRGNTNSGFISPNIFPWGTSKNGGSFQDFFRGFFPNAVLVFPRLFQCGEVPHTSVPLLVQPISVSSFSYCITRMYSQFSSICTIFILSSFKIRVRIFEKVGDCDTSVRTPCIYLVYVLPVHVSIDGLYFTSTRHFCCLCFCCTYISLYKLT